MAGELWKGVCSILKVGRLAIKSPITNNNFRSPKVSMLFSEASLDTTWVSRKENGIIYQWDIARFEGILKFRTSLILLVVLLSVLGIVICMLQYIVPCLETLVRVMSNIPLFVLHLSHSSVHNCDIC